MAHRDDPLPRHRTSLTSDQAETDPPRPAARKSLRKRAFDLTLAGAGLVLLAPLMLAIAIALRLTIGKPVLFRQLRPGLDSRPFTLLKFRTMRLPSPTEQSDASRLTRFGTFLRRSSLDELPELWNVLRGEMSLVGPRPLLMEYLDYYDRRQARRHEVRPGLTGLAQVRGRNALTWEEKFELDVWYVHHWRFALDCKILGETILVVLRRKGISQEGSATAEPFRGNPPRQC